MNETAVEKIKKLYKEVFKLESRQYDLLTNTKILPSAQKRSLDTLGAEIELLFNEIEKIQNNENMSQDELDAIFSEVYINS